MRIAVDMDEVMADTFSKQLEWLASNRNLMINRELFQGKSLEAVLDSDDYSALINAMHEPGFFANLPEMEHASSVLEELYAQHEIYVVTAAMEFPSSFSAKYEWLRTQFPFISPDRMVFCGDKSIINADCMLDDNPKNLTSFSGYGVLFSAPHNLEEQRFRRVDSWKLFQIHVDQLQQL